MENFDYSEVNLIPKKGIVESRSECDTSVKLGKHTFKIPVYPANMESVIDIGLAEELASEGYFYTMHRFGVDQVQFIGTMKNENLISSISIGVNDDSYELLEQLIMEDLIPDYITIDIAHGHSIKMERMLKHIKSLEKFKETYIIAGNISTLEAANDLKEWGASAVKVGIAPGHACTTAMATRFGSRGIQASIVGQIAYNVDIDVIADGGIKEHGDIAVAMVMGAKMVMVGSMLAGFRGSPGERVLGDDGVEYKRYWGSASSQQSGKTNRIEGTVKLIPFKNRFLTDELVSIQESLQSAISYAGGKDLNAFLSTEFYVVKK